MNLDDKHDTRLHETLQNREKEATEEESDEEVDIEQIKKRDDLLIKLNTIYERIANVDNKISDVEKQTLDCEQELKKQRTMLDKKRNEKNWFKEQIADKQMNVRALQRTFDRLSKKARD
jgi:chromosome segregation ATPase